MDSQNDACKALWTAGLEVRRDGEPNAGVGGIADPYAKHIARNRRQKPPPSFSLPYGQGSNRKNTK